MKRSEDRILTTHAGSLPRSQELFELLVRFASGTLSDRDRLDAVVRRDVTTVVERQVDAGLDVVNDGELGRRGFSLEHPERMSGFGGVSPDAGMIDTELFPGYAERIERWTRDTDERLAQAGVGGFQSGESVRPFAPPLGVGAVEYDPDKTDVREQIETFAAAVSAAPRQPVQTFVTAPTPGIISTTMRRAEDNPVYPTDREYVLALARALGKEYVYIVDQGHVLQLDAPDLAMERHFMFAGRPEAEFLDRMDLHVEALNVALENVDRDQVRLHVCWGNYDGPHSADIELATILPRLYEADVGALMLAFANPRHQHEVDQLRASPPREDMLIVAGVIDTTTNYVEHPELVADRIVKVAEVIGDATRVLAGTDCGLSTFAGYNMVAEDVAWAKLRSLAEGAQIASGRLF